MTWTRMLAAAALGLTLVATACDVATDPPTNQPIVGRFTFLQDLEGWTPRALDVIVSPGDEIEWTIERSLDRALVPPASVRFSADNRTDAARLWLERGVLLDPNRSYDVTIAFGFASQDYGDANLWTIMAGALPARPTAAADFGPVERGNTGVGEDAGIQYVWQERQYDFTMTTGASGEMFLVVGFWGTSEFERTYYVDDINVIIRPR